MKPPCPPPPLCGFALPPPPPPRASTTAPVTPAGTTIEVDDRYMCVPAETRAGAFAPLRPKATNAIARLAASAAATANPLLQLPTISPPSGDRPSDDGSTARRQLHRVVR